jgi:hypothetical protein
MQHFDTVDLWAIVTLVLFITGLRLLTSRNRRQRGYRWPRQQHPSYFSDYKRLGDRNG